MLCYLGTGPRYYGQHPVRAYRRHYWEFQAVLKGSIGLQLDSGPELLHQKHLWLCSPQFAHGWNGEGDKMAEVAVFHFLGLPEPLNQFASDKGCLKLSLSDAQCNRLRELAQGARLFWQRPAPGMILYYQHLLLELSWLVYSATHPTCPQPDQPAAHAGHKPAITDGNKESAHKATHPTPQGTSSHSLQGHQRVDTALRWFQARLKNNPSLEEVAHAIGLSSSQLRRLFLAHMGDAPKKVFDQLRFQHAMELMSNPDCKLSTVSEACGFESASAFSRAFKHKFGTSPDRWRS